MLSNFKILPELLLTLTVHALLSFGLNGVMWIYLFSELSLRIEYDWTRLPPKHYFVCSANSNASTLQGTGCAVLVMWDKQGIKYRSQTRLVAIANRFNGQREYANSLATAYREGCLNIILVCVLFEWFDFSFNKQKHLQGALTY